MSSTILNSKNLGARRLRQDIVSQKEIRLLDRLKKNSKLRERQLIVLEFLLKQLSDSVDSKATHGQDKILSELITQVRDDFGFSECGIMRVNAQQMLELYEVTPHGSEGRIRLELDRLKKTRAIVRVLQNKKPALKESSVFGEWLVYHAIRTDKHVLGLFVGVLTEQSLIDGVLVKLLALVLHNTALKLDRLLEENLNKDVNLNRVEHIDFEQCAGKMKFISDRDRLTGLANRENFIHHLDVMISQEIPPSLAIISLDFHEFAKVNDNYGYAAGDQILSEATHRLEARLADNNFINTVGYKGQSEAYLGRIGEDEFGVIVTLRKGLKNKQLVSFTNELLSVLGQNYAVSGGNLVIANSAGVSRFPEQGSVSGDLLSKSQKARSSARRSVGTRVVFFNSDMIDFPQIESFSELELTDALSKGQIQVWYQPKVDVKCKRVVSAEALVRWQHPEKGLILPNDFIPVAEHSGLIHKLGERVLIDACRLISQADEANFNDFRVSINLSSVQIMESDIADNFSKILASEKIKADRFELELTPCSSDYNQQDFAKVLHSLSELGFLISIDDFGMNHSSLSMLRTAPIDILKIDQSFIHGLEGDNNDKLIVSGLVSIGQSLDLQVFAEGVESQAQLESVCELGCDQVQGYYLAKPCGLSEFQALLQEWNITAFD